MIWINASLSNKKIAEIRKDIKPLLNINNRNETMFNETIKLAIREAIESDVIGDNVKSFLAENYNLPNGFDSEIIIVRSDLRPFIYAIIEPYFAEKYNDEYYNYLKIDV